MDEDRDDFKSQLEVRIRRYAAQRDSIQAQLVELNHSLNTTEKRLEAAAEMFRLEFGQEPAALPPDVPSTAESRPRRRRRRADGRSWNDAVAAVLAEAKTPLHVNELWDRLRSSGFESEAKDPIRALVSVLVRHPDVHRMGPNTYGLTNQHGPQESIDGLSSDDGTPSVQQGEEAA